MPRSFFMTVVYGVKARSSRSSPTFDWPFVGHHADDRERLLLDANRLADRIDVRSEELIAHDRSDAPAPSPPW